VKPLEIAYYGGGNLLRKGKPSYRRLSRKLVEKENALASVLSASFKDGQKKNELEKRTLSSSPCASDNREKEREKGGCALSIHPFLAKREKKRGGKGLC